MEVWLPDRQQQVREQILNRAFNDDDDGDCGDDDDDNDDDDNVDGGDG